MMEPEYSFERAPWELLLQSKKDGDVLPAESLLALLEDENSQTMEDAFQVMETRGLAVDVAGLEQTTDESQTGERLRREAHLVQIGFSADDFAQDDPLHIYLKELETIPSVQDEQKIALDAAHGDATARAALANSSLHRVAEIAGDYAGHGVLLMDLIQEGNLSLWQTIQEYRGGDYALLRDRKIRCAMSKAVLMQARAHGVGEKLRSRMQHYQEADKNLLKELGRNPTVAEIAQKMNISLEEANSVSRMLADTLLMKKQTQAKEEPEDQDTGVEDTAYFQIRERVSNLLGQLPKEDADILSMRFGLGKAAPMPPEKVAEKLGLSVREVLDREKNAISLLRKE